MLKLKQQMLQMTIRKISAEFDQARGQTGQADMKMNSYRAVLVDRAGVDIEQLATPKEIQTNTKNVAGVKIPIFLNATFPRPSYSLFATPPWVDGTLTDMKDLNLCIEKEKILQRQLDLIREELTTVIQRVNLFEKVKIPESREAIRKIRIYLGDEMTAAVGRAKIAKTKLTKSEHEDTLPAEVDQA